MTHTNCLTPFCKKRKKELSHHGNSNSQSRWVYQKELREPTESKAGLTLSWLFSGMENIKSMIKTAPRIGRMNGRHTMEQNPWYFGFSIPRHSNFNAIIACNIHPTVRTLTNFSRLLCDGASFLQKNCAVTTLTVSMSVRRPAVKSIPDTPNSA